MENFEKTENKLYISKYGLPKIGDFNEIWNKIKDNKDLLNWAIKPTRDKFDERDLVNGLTISETILYNHKEIDPEIYYKLVDLIYSNEEIARIVIDGYNNGGISYLLLTLFNKDLVLTNQQKEFAVNEAMNKIGTTRYKESKENYSKELTDRCITDDITTMIDIDGSINPIGLKTKYEYFNYIFSSLSDTQAHGIGDFDIRYWILRNDNWSLEEKQKLIKDFWYDDDEYDEILDSWEWEVVNDYGWNVLDKYSLNEYSYEDLMFLFDDKETVDKTWAEIEFLRQMHELRPQQWEVEHVKQKTLEKND